MYLLSHRLHAEIKVHSKLAFAFISPVLRRAARVSYVHTIFRGPFVYNNFHLSSSQLVGPQRQNTHHTRNHHPSVIPAEPRRNTKQIYPENNSHPIRDCKDRSYQWLIAAEFDSGPAGPQIIQTTAPSMPRKPHPPGRRSRTRPDDNSPHIWSNRRPVVPVMHTNWKAPPVLHPCWLSERLMGIQGSSPDPGQRSLSG